MLDDLELPQVQEIGTYDRRALAEHQTPGAETSQLQDMGRRPTRVALWGVATGDDAASFVDKLEAKYRAGTPFDFIADITTDAHIEKVAIDNLQLQEIAGRPDRTAFVLSLRQFLEPAEPQDLAAVDASILDDAAGVMAGLVDGLALGQEFVTGLEKYVGVLSGLFDRVQRLPHL
jgi:DNA circularisation protein N-terminus